MRLADRTTFEALESRLKTILPEDYRDRYNDVQPVSMGSASLKYWPDGTVAWNHIWTTFCDLAMAGGPPHKGTLLQPGTPREVAEQQDRYGEVVDEICRGVSMVTNLDAKPFTPGWLRVTCTSESMAGWLVRAIVMENVSARCEGTMLDLPAGPGYRLAKEIKNVITVIAKTCHYWSGHMPQSQQQAIANLLVNMDRESPLLQPALSGDDFNAGAQQLQNAKISESIWQATGLQCTSNVYDDWLGMDCGNVRAAIWMMRLLVASNVLSRREGTSVFVPIDSLRDPGGVVVTRLILQTHRLATAHVLF